MLKSMTAIAVAAVAGAAMAQTGTATYNGQDFPFNTDQNRGGAFNWTLGGGLAGFGDNGGNALKTFCVELGENTPGVGTTLNGQVNTVAITGGTQPALQSQTAYLFTQFKLGSNGDFTSDFTTELNQRAMQLAIWHFEEGLGSFDAFSGTYTLSNNTYLGGLTASEQTQLLDFAAGFIGSADLVVGAGAWTGIGNVRVLNLGTNSNNWGNQDMLIMIPLPGASAMAGLGLLAVGTRRRRVVA